MPCLVSLTGIDCDFQSLSWATWATSTHQDHDVERWSIKPVFQFAQYANMRKTSSEMYADYERLRKQAHDKVNKMEEGASQI